MDFGVLGTLLVRREGSEVAVPTRMLRNLLATLLCRANRTVARDVLVAALWRDQPPRTADKTLSIYVHRLRAVLGTANRVVMSSGAGYRLDLTDNDLDAQRFERLAASAASARSHGDLATASSLMNQALSLWRGEAFAGIGDNELVAAEALRLDELRVTAVEEWAETELELGRHGQLCDELFPLAADHPYRERLTRALMLALYRGGRQAEALDVYQNAYRTMSAELGIRPGPDLQLLHQRMLREDPELLWRAVSTAAVVAGHAPIPAQLPAAIREFTGRGQELGALDDAAYSCAGAAEVIAISGTAGVGKTALVLHWAHRARAAFGDGQLFADLRGFADIPPLRPVQVLARFLQAMGVPSDQIPTEIDAAASLYRSVIADRRMLVVLDNARNADHVRPLLPGTPGCLTIVTSRDRLTGLVAGESARCLHLDVLTPDEAVGLLGQLVGARVQRDRGAAGRLAELCAHLPLAIRIAAAHLAGTPEVSIGQYVDALCAGDVLSAVEIAGDERMAARRAFQRSYAALHHESRRIFRLIGLAPGPTVTVDTAAALAGIAASAAEAGLRHLTEASLLESRIAGQAGADRLHQHDLLRRFAAERAADDEGPAERSAAIARLMTFYVQRVGAAARAVYPHLLRLPAICEGQQEFGDSEGALSWLDAEHENLVTAVQHCAEHGPTRLALLLADGMRGYLSHRMLGADWHAVASAALDAATREADEAAMAAAQLSLALLHHRHSHPSLAAHHAGLALAHARRAGWRDGELAALGSQGNIYRQSGRRAEAIATMHDILDATEDATEDATDESARLLPVRAATLGNLGILYAETDQPDRAEHFHRQALRAYESLGAIGGQALALTNLAETRCAQGYPGEARELIQRALELHRRTGERGAEAESLRILAEAELSAGDLGAAEAAATQALALICQAERRRHEADILVTLGSIQHAEGDSRTAAATLRQALALAKQLGDPRCEARAATALAKAGEMLTDR